MMREVGLYPVIAKKFKPYPNKKSDGRYHIYKDTNRMGVFIYCNGSIQQRDNWIQPK